MATLHENWNQFVILHNGSFLQSWEWGEFQRCIGKDVWRFVMQGGEIGVFGDSLNQKSKRKSQNCKSKIKSFGLDEVEDTAGVVQFIETSLPFGLQYWYGPRGPVLELPTTNYQLPTTLTALSKALTSSNIVFLRLDPAWPPEWRDVFLESGWQETADIQPRRNWALDVGGSDETLLEGMHSKTRYNIRLAEKNGVRIRRGDAADDFDGFWRLTEETKERHGIRSHGRRYYKEMLAMPIAELWQAEYNGTVIASHIMVFFGNRATYLHGASSYQDRSLMAPYLLHWNAIREAKQRGFAEYDFGGVDAARWPGITRFKQGFGGKEEVSMGAFNLPLRPVRYALYTLGRALVRNRRSVI